MARSVERLLILALAMVSVRPRRCVRSGRGWSATSEHAELTSKQGGRPGGGWKELAAGAEAQR